MSTQTLTLALQCLQCSGLLTVAGLSLLAISIARKARKGNAPNPPPPPPAPSTRVAPAGEKACANCGKVNRPQAKKCAGCGSKL